MKFESFAHGRVTLLGLTLGAAEHETETLTLSMATPQKLSLRLERRADQTIQVESDLADGTYEKMTYLLSSETQEGKWSDLIQETTRRLAAEGHRVLGFDLKIQSSIPMGLGLGSSAALTVALIKALRSAYDLKLTDIEIAALSRKIETACFGPRGTLADHMTSALIRPAEALILDAQQIQFDRVSIPLEAMDLAVLDCGLSLGGFTTQTSRLTQECSEISRRLEVKSLREIRGDDVRLKDLSVEQSGLPKFVREESERVQAAVQALRAREMSKLGTLFQASQKALSEDLGLSHVDLTAILKIVRDEPEIYGARMTSGFISGGVSGGQNLTLSLLTKPRRAAEIADNLMRAIQAKFKEAKPKRLV